MTKEQWKTVEDNWFSKYQFEFMIDGYKLCLQRGLDKNKLFYFTYVNDVYKHAWLRECEESKRFLQKHSKATYSSKEIARWKKILGKKEYAEQKDKYEKKFEWYEPYWTTFSSFKKHITANNKSIELIDN